MCGTTNVNRSWNMLERRPFLIQVYGVRSGISSVQPAWFRLHYPLFVTRGRRFSLCLWSGENKLLRRQWVFCTGTESLFFILCNKDPILSLQAEMEKRGVLFVCFCMFVYLFTLSACVCDQKLLVSPGSRRVSTKYCVLGSISTVSVYHPLTSVQKKLLTLSETKKLKSKS